MASAQRRNRTPTLAVRQAKDTHTRRLFSQMRSQLLNHGSCLHCKISFFVRTAWSIACAGCKAVDLIKRQTYSPVSHSHVIEAVRPDDSHTSVQHRVP